MGKFISNLVAGKLDNKVASNQYFICCKVLDHTNHFTVARSVNDGLTILWLTGVQEGKTLILYSDAEVHILKDVTALKLWDFDIYQCVSYE
jgi:hypothetical protein